MAIDFNKPYGLLDFKPNSTGSLGINISPINEQKKLEDEQRKKEEQRLKLQNLADTFYMIGANQSGDTQRMAFHSNRLAQRKAEQEARQLKAQQDMEIRNYFGDNENLATIAKIAGVPTAINMQQAQKAQQQEIAKQNEQAEINALQERRKINAYIDAGYTEGQAFAIVVGGAKPEDVINVGIDEESEEENRKIKSLINAGYTKQEAEAIAIGGVSSSDLQKLKTTDVSKPLESLDAEIEKEYEQSEGLQLIDQAFGLKDTIDNAANKLLGPVLFTPAKETNAAVNSKSILNENLRERFVNQYSGRPSVYLNQRIDALLPMGNYISEFDAMQKYQEIKRVLDQGRRELQANINSGIFTGKDLLTLQNEYKSTSFLIRDLETVIGNLDKSKVNLDTKGLTSDGTYNFVFEKDSGF
jgi:hypothetical protein